MTAAMCSMLFSEVKSAVFTGRSLQHCSAAGLGISRAARNKSQQVRAKEKSASTVCAKQLALLTGGIPSSPPYTSVFLLSRQPCDQTCPGLFTTEQQRSGEQKM